MSGVSPKSVAELMKLFGMEFFLESWYGGSAKDQVKAISSKQHKTDIRGGVIFVLICPIYASHMLGKPQNAKTHQRKKTTRAAQQLQTVWTFSEALWAINIYQKRGMEILVFPDYMTC